MSTTIDQYKEEVLIEMYRKLRTIREFELKAYELVNSGAFPGGPHLYIGQEAVAVGACLPLRKSDIIGSTHRGHGHLIAKDADIKAMMAELGGTVAGLNNGRGGTMHMVDFSLGIFGANGILGASSPHVAGGLYAAQLDGEDRVGIAFFGDGAVNEGVVYETMNLASVWDLPIIFVCENNKYAVTLSAEDAVAGNQISDRAAAMGIPSTTIDGQDVFKVYDEVSKAVDSTRSGSGPHFVECETYRYHEHSFNTEKALAGREYRSDGEIERWRGRDPIDIFVEKIEGHQVLSDEKRRAIDEEIEDEIEAGVRLMQETDHPPASDAHKDMYTDEAYPNFPAERYR